MIRTRWNWAPIMALALVGHQPDLGSAQDLEDAPSELFAEVMPGADLFGPKQGDPPVYEAFSVDPSTGTQSLVGYVFLTSDLPPEVFGYSAPITVLVGINLEGTLTGIELVAYRESLRASRGDFLNRAGYLRQFGGKHVANQFRVRRDVDNISGATITVDAMSRGIRNAARRVAAVYLRAAAPDAAPDYIGTIGLAELDALLWAEMLTRGLATQVNVTEGAFRMVLSMVYLAEPAVGELLVGATNFQSGLDSLGTREEEHHMMLMGLGGEDPFFFRRNGLSFVQGADTIAVPSEDLVMFPLLRDGKLQGEVRRSGLLYVDDALDLAQPFEVVLDLAPRGDRASSAYRVMPSAPVVASGPSSPVTGTDLLAPEVTEAAGQMVAGPPGPTTADPGSGAAGGAPAIAEGLSPDGQAIDYGALLFEDEEEEQTALARVLERTSWVRVAGFVILLSLATWTFVAKGTGLRWVTVAATFLLLGYLDGGFLSVSHILAGISVGPSVYLGDLPLLMLVVFTVVTTLLWGRVFCGFLCPFGALQDLLERIVPKRLQRELPRAVHERALLVKYLILALILAPVLVGSSITIFQYFEPFGTVFYWSSSVLLWTIAGGILVASAIVPRFYCRYACPLGAALALGSLVAPFRIRRVEQCDFCKVCEQKCPTGAIKGPTIDFKECVRCNTCEIQLIEKTGSCGHDMEVIRSRIVNLPMAGAGASDA